MPGAVLSTTIVTYLPDAVLLRHALRSLAAAMEHARAGGQLERATLFVVDNGPPEARQAIEEVLGTWPRATASVALVSGHGNIGYGRANNSVIGRLDSEFHLVMNPDVELEREALAAAIDALRAEARFGLVAPAAYAEDGTLQYLCRRYPSLWVLFLRGFAPAWLRRRCAGTLEAYEMRDVIDGQVLDRVPLASGCFMLVRTELFRRLGGFDPRFFLYFEDYDLSLRVGREASVAYVPQVRIIHHGGEAARKGWRHVLWFLRSAWRFFATHGWKIT